MKKFIPCFLFLLSCRSQPKNLYVNHTRSQFSISDDTLEIADTVIIEHSGFQRIHHGHLLPKEFKTKRLFELQPQFKGNKLLLNQTIYEKI